MNNRCRVVGGDANNSEHDIPRAFPINEMYRFLFAAQTFAVQVSDTTILKNDM